MPSCQSRLLSHPFNRQSHDPPSSRSLPRPHPFKLHQHSGSPSSSIRPSSTTPSIGPYKPKLSQVYNIPKLGTIKVSLQSKSTLGIAQSRGERPYQEDYFTVASLDVKVPELIKAIPKAEGYEILTHTHQNHPLKLLDHHQPHLQSLLVGVIDGHGGTDSAEYLSKNLSRLIEESSVTELPNVIRTYRSIGGYFRRFRGGFLQDLAQEAFDPKTREDQEPPLMGIDERLSLGFLMADQQVMSSFPKSGAVTTAALLTPLPIRTHDSSSIIYPYFSSPLLSLIVGHVGDTCGLLCSAIDGRVVRLTEDHHPDSRVEAERLRRMGTGLITDSFGESRWGGSLANSRGLGDSSFKALGVTGEPDILNKIIRGDEWEFLILVSDGISNVITHQEIVDLCKGAKSATEAASNVVNFAETLGGRDNMTAVVVPLMKWGNVDSHDLTVERRKFRLKQLQASSGSGRQRRM